MNEYLTACTDIVTAQGGTLDKYIGDAVVAMFGAPIPLPDHAYRACVATQLVHLKLNELRAKWTTEGDKWPEIVKKMQSRIGINSGPVVAGVIGKSKYIYDLWGDTVNLASRMEATGLPGAIQVTRPVFETLRDKYAFESRGEIEVKGKGHVEAWLLRI